MPDRSVLFVLPSASYRIADFVGAGAALGVDILVATEGHQTLADQMGDRLIPIDLGDERAAAAAIVAAAATRRIDAILPVDDRGVLTAALAGEELHLEHNPPAAVAATRNKATLRRALAGVVHQPAFSVIGPLEDAGATADAIGFPAVVKPLSLSASRGVMRVDTRGEAVAAADRLRRILAVADLNPNEPILVEQFVPGPEVAIDGLLRDGEWTTLAVFDKPDPLDGPYFEETMFVTPSRHHPEIVSEIERVAAAAASALGLRTGPVHAEMRIDGARVVLLELAARTIGGLCSRALRFGLNETPVEQLLIRNALGDHVRGIRRESRASGVAMVSARAAGTFAGIDGVEQAAAIPGVEAIEVTVAPGRHVRPLPEEGAYLAFVFARADRPAAVEDALRAATGRVSVRID